MLVGRVTVPTEMMPTGLHCELRLLREVATVTPMHLWQMSTQSPNKQRSGQCPHLSHSPGRSVCDGSVSVPHTRDPACLVSARCVLTFGVWAFSCPGVRASGRGLWEWCRHRVHLQVPGHVLVYLCMPEEPGDDSLCSLVTGGGRDCTYACVSASVG